MSAHGPKAERPDASAIDLEQAELGSPKVSQTSQDPQFSLLNRQPGSEIFTKFADVKSRISWTAERRQQLQEMWDRGDKAPVSPRPWGARSAPSMSRGRGSA